MAPLPGKITPEIRAKILAWRAEGRSYDSIAVELDRVGVTVSKQTVANTIRAAEREPAVDRDLKPEKRGRGRPPKHELPADLGENARVDADALATAVLEASELSELEPLERLKHRLNEIQVDIAYMRPRVRSGAVSATTLTHLTREESRLIQEIVALEGPKPVPPEEDPTILSARDFVLGVVLDSIRDAETLAEKYYKGAEVLERGTHAEEDERDRLRVGAERARRRTAP